MRWTHRNHKMGVKHESKVHTHTRIPIQKKLETTLFYGFQLKVTVAISLAYIHWKCILQRCTAVISVVPNDESKNSGRTFVLAHYTGLIVWHFGWNLIFLPLRIGISETIRERRMNNAKWLYSNSNSNYMYAWHIIVGRAMIELTPTVIFSMLNPCSIPCDCSALTFGSRPPLLCSIHARFFDFH